MFSEKHYLALGIEKCSLPSMWGILISERELIYPSWYFLKYIFSRIKMLGSMNFLGKIGLIF